MVFREKIIAVASGAHVSAIMIASWLAYLLAIGFGALYQYFAVKYLDSLSRAPGQTGRFKYLEANPGVMYGPMLVSFFLASFLLIIAAADMVW